jgi:sugar (pentulose or hexulose) kinase
VGGGSKNHFLRQIISDVFNAPSNSIRAAEYAAPLGCAISGARNALGLTYAQAMKRFVQADNSKALEPLKRTSQQ